MDFASSPYPPLNAAKSWDEIENFLLVSGRASFPNEMTIGQTRPEQNRPDQTSPI